MRIFKVNLDNAEYFIELKDNKLVKGKEINGETKYDITEDENKVIDHIFNLLAPSKNYTVLRNIEYKNKTYSHLMDDKNSFHIFYEIKDGKLQIPDEDTLSFFNKIFNTQNEYFANNEDYSNNDGYFKRIVKIGKKAIIVFIASNMCFNVLGGTLNVKASTGDYNDGYIYSQGEQVEPYEKEEISLTYDDIVSLVNENQKLLPEEKELILSNKDFFDDNLQYMDHNHVKTMLQNLHINYLSRSNGIISGQYYPYSYFINMYNVNNFIEANKSTLTHELYHAFAIPKGSFDALGYGYKTIEALNMIITNEYNAEAFGYDMGYEVLKPYAKILCEIVPNDTLKHSFFSGNVSLINNYLRSIVNDDAMIKDLFTTIDANLNISNELLTNPQNSEDLNALYKNNNDAIMNYFKIIYEAKTNTPIESNEEFMYYYDKAALLSNLIGEGTYDSKTTELAVNFTTPIKSKNYFKVTNNDNNTVLNVCSKVEPHNCELSKIDKKVYLEEGMIQEINGQYVINPEYQDKLFIQDDKLYQKGYTPVEFEEYVLNSNNLTVNKEY